MTFTEFLQLLNGNYLEVAGSPNAKNQCVDLANAYIRSVLKQQIIEWTDAVDFPSKADRNIYDFIENTPSGVPQEGDIVVWKPTPGHIAIFIEGNSKRFTSFDQNFPTGSPCHVQEHTYQNVVGWLRYKQGIPSGDTISIEKAVFEKLVGNSGKWDETINYLEIVTDPKDTPFDQVRSVIGGYKSAMTTAQNDAAQWKTEAENREEQVSRLKEQLLSAQKLAETAQSANNEQLIALRGRVAELTTSNNTLAKDKGELAKQLTAAKMENGYEVKINLLGKYFIGKKLK